MDIEMQILWANMYYSIQIGKLDWADALMLRIANKQEGK